MATSPTSSTHAARSSMPAPSYCRTESVTPPSASPRYRSPSSSTPSRARTGAEHALRIGVLAPIAWRTPPRHYGPWELFASLLADGLVAAGHDVTLFATADSVTTAELRSTSPHGWNDDDAIEPKVAEALHIADAFEHAGDFD